ncbi:MAG: CatB-related O-acetyltransferase [Campylobacterota bacterium]|nr:CatB-related O-acetyltransferase [Campylobacterota bacterium]
MEQNKKSIANLEVPFSTKGGGSFINSKSTIGKYCSIGMYAMIGPGQHPINFLSTSSFQYLPHAYLLENDNIAEFESHKACCIGNDVWIGVSAIVQDGVNIGDGAIIGSNAVVTKDIPPYAIAVGVPAKIIKYRFTEDIIEKLLDLKWWDLDIESIKKLPFSNIQECIGKLEQIRNK